MGASYSQFSGARLAQSRNRFQASIDLPLQGERIELGFFLLQPQLGLRRHFGAGQHPRQGRLGGSVNALEPTFRAFFALQLETGVKVIEQLPVGSLDQPIDRFDDFGVVVPLMPKHCRMWVQFFCSTCALSSFFQGRLRVMNTGRGRCCSHFITWWFKNSPPLSLSNPSSAKGKQASIFCKAASVPA